MSIHNSYKRHIPFLRY